jgi:hypothetical protein
MNKCSTNYNAQMLRITQMTILIFWCGISEKMWIRLNLSLFFNEFAH